MNNIKHLFFLAAMLLLVGCRKDIVVNLSEHTHSFEAVGGSTEIALESNGSWQVNDCPEWLSITPMSGEGNATLILTCESNISDQERSAEIKVSTKTNKTTLSVTQAFVEGNFIVFTPEAIHSDFLGGDFSVRVDANCDWSINTLPDWIYCEPMSGTQSANIVVTISQYSFTSESNREFTIDFTAGEQHFYLPVQQDNGEAYQIIATPRSIDAGSEGLTQTVMLQSIASWIVECPVDWVSVTPTSGDGNGEITVTVAPNNTYSTRSARIALTSAVECTSFIVVRQEAAVNPHYLEVSPSDLLFPGEESTLDITVSSDSLWTVICRDSWLSLSQDSGIGDATISITASAHALFGDRHADLELVSGSISRRITITQVSSATEPVLSFSTNLIQTESDHTICPVSISSNVGWTMRMSEDWVLAAVTEGIGDANINLVVKENTAEEPRTAMVVLYYNNVPYDTLVIEQAAHVYYVEANVTELNASQQGDTFVVSVTANQGWSVSTDSSWLSFNPSQGSGDGTFRIIVNANNTPAARMAEVKLSGEKTGIVLINVHQSN